MEIKESAYPDIKSKVDALASILIEKGIDASFANWQAKYSIASELQVSMVELELFMCKIEREKKMEQEKSLFVFEPVEKAAFPAPRGNSAHTSAYRPFYEAIHRLPPDGDGFRVRLPNKKTMQALQTAAQLCSRKSRKGRSQTSQWALPEDQKVTTRSEPVNGRADGEYYLYVRVRTVNI